MTDAVQTPPSAPAAPSGTSAKKKKSKRKIRNIIIAVVVLAALGVGIYFLMGFLNQEETVDSTLQTQPVGFGSIESRVTGSGNARAKESAAITLTQSGIVQTLNVSSGDQVTAGQPLYTIYSEAAEKAVITAQEGVTSAQKEVTDAQKALADVQQGVTDERKELERLQAKTADLTLTAPFAGKITEAAKLNVGDDLASGTAVCTLVNDKQLKLSLYFSYAYDGAISVGQSANVSIPATMGTYIGTVEAVNKVHYISPEGADHFEVIIVFPNAGTLTADMAASASLTAADGTAIYPYANGKTEYYEIRNLTTKVSGALLSKNVMNYADVTAGQTLLTLSGDKLEEEIRAQQERLAAAQERVDAAVKSVEDAQKRVTEAEEKVTEAQKALADFNAVAPIDGTVTSCTLVEGAEVKNGDTVITIANNLNMVVDITVDDRNISFVQPGMTVELSDWNGNIFIGTVTAINMGSAESSNGMTSYPVTLSVDNSSGTLMAGMWLDYSFVASQSDNCLTVPTQSVKYVSGDDGETYPVVFIKAEEKPENAVEITIPPVEPGQTPQYPTPEDGFYPVPVETGLDDSYNVEITSGLNGDEEVFVNYYVEQAWG